jgi:methionyl-tRNA formyltransferase
MPSDDLRFGYLGYSTVTKEILDNIDVDPELVISFTEEVEEEYGRGVSYENYPSVRVDTINSEKAKNAIEERGIDVLLVMGWPELLDPELIEAPEVGCVGRHLSLLPERRGRAPVAWALIHGLDETGVSLFWIDEGVDSGDLIEQQTVSVDPSDHAEDLHSKCTQASISVLNEEVLPRFRENDFSAEPQDENGATYTHPRRPDMGIIDWTDSAWDVHNFIRGQSHPYPGAFTYHKMSKITMWKTKVKHETVTKEAPGTVVGSGSWDEESWLVQCGEGLVDITVEYSEGADRLKEGDRLGAVPY